ncbi:putative transcription factor interactor and regulator CCHC(Zn) family [Helianthus annuus]|nr:putative transcription factor interactor and regulator CCHC(Zn) family [Helianthus annuus]
MSDSSEEFYNAFTSESSDRRSETRNYSKEISDHLKFDSLYGSQQKPPKLMKIEDYNWWKNRFEGWVKAFAPESWLKLKYGYTEPVKEGGELVNEKEFTEIDVKNLVAENKMITLLHQSVREDIISLLENEKTSKGLWEALERKCLGSAEIIKNKKKLLRKEYDLFGCFKNESVCQTIERFGHLKLELARHGVVYSQEELVDKLFDSLPDDPDWQYYALMLKNTIKSEDLTVDLLIERLESHELETRKTNKVKTYQQNVELYYRGNMFEQKSNSGFSAESSKDSPQQSSSRDPGYHSFDSNSSNPNIVHCNIAIDLKNFQSLNAEAAKRQMVFLASILESYESLIAGKVGNPKMTKEDYDQIDPEEMELMDIKWCMASTMRRAQRFMEITRRSSLASSDSKLGFDKAKVTCFKCKQKGHFKRGCTNRETDEPTNAFKDDYYKKAIYHRSSGSSNVNQKQIDEGSSKSRAMAVIHDMKVTTGVKFILKKMWSDMHLWLRLILINGGKETMQDAKLKNSGNHSKKPREQKDGMMNWSVTWIHGVILLLTHQKWILKL